MADDDDLSMDIVTFGFIKEILNKNGYRAGYKEYKDVVAFSTKSLCEFSIELTGGSMPSTWHPRYGWSDLNMLDEAIFRFDRKIGRLVFRPDGLRSYIEAFFGESKNGRLFMTVFAERIPGEVVGEDSVAIAAWHADYAEKMKEILKGNTPDTKAGE